MARTFLLALKPVWSLPTQVFFMVNSLTYDNSIAQFTRWLVTSSFSFCKGQNKAIYVTILCVIFICKSYTLMYAGKVVRYTEFYKIEKEAPLLYSSLGTSLGADALITGSLCILLAKSRSGFKKTDSLISILILFMINTGLLTMVIARYIIWPHNFIFMGIYFVLGMVYYNSLLTSLNAQPMFCAKLNIGMNPLQLSDRKTDLSLNSTEPYSLHAKCVMV
ncbi:hypothetical protein BDQ17DRAFT_1332523 [Cyathus striatus]|nr:hypothetical protein BDQ17DRAFT_1332523 [Cyathus striatus]